MAFTDLFQELTDVYKADHTEMISYKNTQDDTLLGDITEQFSTNLKYGEALENIKSTAKTLLHTQDQLVELRDKIAPLSLDTDNLENKLVQVKKQTNSLRNRSTEVRSERITKEQKLHEMESKVTSKGQQVWG